MPFLQFANAGPTRHDEKDDLMKPARSRSTVILKPRRAGMKVTSLVFGSLIAVFAAWIILGQLSVTPETGLDAPQSSEIGDGDYLPIAVPTNRGEETPDGFQGEVHPLLHGQTRLEVAAHWSGVGTGRDRLDKSVPAKVYRLFSEFSPATERTVYTEREFSAFLPESLEGVGQTWAIAPERVVGILRQFHPQPSVRLLAFGRRAGPDGAFAILKAMSPTHLEIMFRLHAEFDLAQNVWLTPACFLGQLLIDREAGTVKTFRLWVPTDNPLNMHLTAAESKPPGGTRPTVFREIRRGDFVIARRDIVRVERMELVSDSFESQAPLAWTDSIELTTALHQLKQEFYAFESIDWAPWQQATAIAAERHRPILAFVLWGALDDQSC